MKFNHTPRLEIFEKYFLSFPNKNHSPEKIETNKRLLFTFLSDKIVQNTNFAKLPVPNCLIGIPYFRK